MLISPAAWRALVDAGVLVVPLDAVHIELRCGPDREAMKVVSSSAVLNPSDIAKLKTRDQEPVLVVVPSATPAVRAAVEAAGWSWLIDSGHGVEGLLRVAGRQLTIGKGNPAAPQRRTPPGRVPWGTFTLVRRLAERPWAGQRQLAIATGVSQPRVSQALATLTEQGLAHRTATGWDVTDIDAVWDWWLDSYPGPGGLRTLWYGLEPPAKQAEAVVGLLRGLDQGPVAISGDVAADVLAPWRSPRRAVVYAHTGADLSDAGLTPADEEDATLELVVPKDPGIWPASAAEETVGSGPLADPLQILWDVVRAPGPDAHEAAQHLRRVLHGRRRPAKGGHAA